MYTKQLHSFQNKTRIIDVTNEARIRHFGRSWKVLHQLVSTSQRISESLESLEVSDVSVSEESLLELLSDNLDVADALGSVHIKSMFRTRPNPEI